MTKHHVVPKPFAVIYICFLCSPFNIFSGVENYQQKTSYFE